DLHDRLNLDCRRASSGLPAQCGTPSQCAPSSTAHEAGDQNLGRESAGSPSKVDSPTLAHALRAVIFDVDGTLADTERDGHRVAFNEAFAAAGLSYRWDVAEYGELLATTGGRRRIERYLRSRQHSPDEVAALAAKLHKDKT